MDIDKAFLIEGAFEARVLSNECITPRESSDYVHSLSLEVNDQLGLQIGIHVGIVVPLAHTKGRSYQERLYSITDLEELDQVKRFKLCVRRTRFTDPQTGQTFSGIVSNHICDAKAGSTLLLTGPYGPPFVLPEDPNSHLVLIAQGTGLAPFRAMVKELAARPGEWCGQVHVFFGPLAGPEVEFIDNSQNEYLKYMDPEGYQAFLSLIERTRRELGGNPIPIGELLHDEQTFVYVVGVAGQSSPERALSDVAGHATDWLAFKKRLQASHRWQELFY